MIFGWALSTIFVTRLFAAALIKSAYRVQKYLLDTTPYYDSRKHPTGDLTTESDSDDDSDKKGD